MKETFECSLTLMAQTSFEFSAEPDSDEFDDAIEKKRDDLIAKLEGMGFSVSVLSEDLS